jgi:hypothetical protein
VKPACLFFRVECATHGVLRVQLPWARPGEWVHAAVRGVRRAAHGGDAEWPALARLVGENDTRLWRIVQWHVEDARARVDMSEAASVVVDETNRAKRHSHVSLFPEPDRSPTSAGSRRQCRRPRSRSIAST